MNASPIALALLLVAAPNAARADGLLLGPEYRWTERNVFERAAADLVAIPANVTNWEAGDWVQLAGWSAAIGTLMFAGQPSPDVQLDRWVTAHLDDHVPEVWAMPMQLVLWPSLAAGVLGSWGWATAAGEDDVAQGASLMLEAFAVSQAYHFALKLLIGRDGPGDGNGLGEVLGPVNGFRVYPAGTPSGHAATLYSLMSAGFAYFQPPLLVKLLGHAVVGGLIGFHVVNHRHFISESLWGAALGWYVGEWVVTHRASWRFGDRKDEGSRLVVLPFASENATGLALSGAF